MAAMGWFGIGFLLLFLFLVILGASGPVLAGERIQAKLRGFEEVPAISSTGTGEFRGKMGNDEASIDYELTYANLEGTTTLAAHIHLGQKSVNGGVGVFLCGGRRKTACPPTSRTVTGTVVAADVIPRRDGA